MVAGSAPVVPQSTATALPSATAPIPDGYLRLQTAAAIRSRSKSEHIEEVRTIVRKIQKQQPDLTFDGVALVDQQTGQIVALISASELAPTEAQLNARPPGSSPAP
jgi:hypothetical protein